jgi:hypothetical protein
VLQLSLRRTVIRQLADDEIGESRTLDFNEQLDLSLDGRQALAEDVCACANTVGGDLIFGMRETAGVASAPVPVVIADLDEELQLTNFLRDATEPPVTAGLLTRIVPIDGGHVVVLRVAGSPNAQHRVLRNGQFYLRNSVGKEPMDIGAIRTAFAFGASLVDRAFDWSNSVSRRCGSVAHRGRSPPEPLLVSHVVPVLSLTRRDAHPIEQLMAAAMHLAAGYELGRPRVNYEGAICLGAADKQHQHFGYGQLFRDGRIELVGTPSVAEAGQDLARALYPASMTTRWSDAASPRPPKP